VFRKLLALAEAEDDHLEPVVIEQRAAQDALVGWLMSGSGENAMMSLAFFGKPLLREESKKMNVTTARKSFEDVTEQTLEEVFADDSLRGEFIILSADDAMILQAGGEGEGPYVLEYREERNQFQALAQLTKHEVKEAFLDCLRGGSEWRTKRQWKPLPIKKGCFKQAAALLLFLGVVAMLLVRIGP